MDDELVSRAVDGLLLIALFAGQAWIALGGVQSF
jgi:hypothetical protein